MKPVRFERAAPWVAATLVWGACALLVATQQWAELRGTPKAMSWIATLLYQAPSWLLLVPATPLLLRLVRRRPLGREWGWRVIAHLLGSAIFGVLFLGIAAPVRHAFHPSPVRWTFFGDAIYKSAPQFIVLGALAYWAIVLVGSLLETRERLASTIAGIEARSAGRPSAARITLDAPSGRVHLPVDRIAWIEPASCGATLHTDDGEIRVRHGLAALETMLDEHGFVRTHRSTLVNVARVRDVSGGASRDGEVTLDRGDRLPLSRRRRGALEERLAAP